MNSRSLSSLFIIFLFLVSACINPKTNLEYIEPDVNVVFLHHCTGRNVWYGDLEQNKKLYIGENTALVPRIIKAYNNSSGSKISVFEKDYPGKGYPWRNYPYDYYNLWLKNARIEPYQGQETLKMLTKEYDINIFKHCFPVSSVRENDCIPDINSEKKTIANYKLQYNAIKNKMHEFSQNTFIVSTGAALVEAKTNKMEAIRFKEFYRWVLEEWDDENDNIEIFDFRKIKTDGGLYLKPEYVKGENDSHPNKNLSVLAAKKLAQFIIKLSTK